MLYKPVKVTLANTNVTTSDDTIAGSGRPKNKTCLSELKTIDFILWQPLVTKTNDYTASKSLK